MTPQEDSDVENEKKTLAKLIKIVAKELYDNPLFTVAIMCSVNSKLIATAQLGYAPIYITNALANQGTVDP